MPAVVGAARALPAPTHALAPESAATREPLEPTLLITEPAALAALEQAGLTLSGVLGGAPEALGNAELARLPAFAPLLSVLEREIAQAAARDKLAGVDVARYSHRLFDKRFLRRPEARFELAGVVNRPDRAPFHPGSCGETRLIYRLSYALDTERASKLPLTLGVELPAAREGADCRRAAARWLEPPAGDARRRAAWLRSESGPLAPSRTRVVAGSGRVVVNLQLVRWPATVRPDLGGHAEYLLRSFRVDASGLLQPEPLENSVDAARLRGAGSRRELAQWLEREAERVDAGTPLVPQRFLAERAISVTPRGLHRLANRPFATALREEELRQRDYAQGRLIKSPSALLRRLDQLSCQGCHQARSVAGFHLLGEDTAQAPSENALALGVSPQVLADLPRRLRIARQLLAGDAPDFTAPFAERAGQPGRYGDHCGLGSDPSFASWTCDPELECSSIEGRESDSVGQCLPRARQVGDACERGRVTQTSSPERDRMQGVKLEPCPQMVCNRSGVGFPGGMCTASCGAQGAGCGAIAILDAFNACLARGEGFLSCIRGNAQPAGLRRCSAAEPCRDDYVCARAEGGGVCLPPYFVFQLRVDGHSSGLR